MELPNDINKSILESMISEILGDTVIYDYEYLYTKYDLRDSRTVRKYIAVARKMFKAPIANVKGGYKKAVVWDEYKKTFHTQIAHAVSIIKTQKAVRDHFIKQNNYTLFDQTVFDSEFEEIINAVNKL